MKFPSLSLLLAGSLFVASCTSSSETTTVGSAERGGADQAPSGYINNTASETDFKSYKTYGWASQITDATNSVYFVNDVAYKNTIRDAVAHELEARGYVYQPTSPDLLVNFRVFDQPTEIKDNAGYGDRYWTTNEYRGNPSGVVKLDRGSVILQLVDRKQGEVVWQGYASGLSEGDTMAKEQTKVVGAVSKVFEQYTYRAD